MEKKQENHEVFVQFNITHLKAPTKKRGAIMEIEFAYPQHMKASQERAERMIDKLMMQESTGRIDDIKIKGLALSWAEEE
jgi:hypothetical protein